MGLRVGRCRQRRFERQRQTRHPRSAAQTEPYRQSRIQHLFEDRQEERIPYECRLGIEGDISNLIIIPK